jgi:hypothetical protein
MSPNFVFLNATLPDVARLVAAMVQARAAVGRRSWSHPQEPTTEEWRADVLADARARRQERRASDLPMQRAFYTLADEPHETVLVACSKCDWRAAFSRDELVAVHGADYVEANRAPTERSHPETLRRRCAGRFSPLLRREPSHHKPIGSPKPFRAKPGRRPMKHRKRKGGK